MNLIGRNKVAEYILKHPDARIPLLFFLKEFPHRSERYLGDSQDISDGTFQIDGFDCIIKVRINDFAKAINIIALSTKEEEMAKWQAARKDQEVITVVVAIEAPPPPGVEEKIQHKESKENNFHLVNPEVNNTASLQNDFYSASEYEQYLNRINAIFEAKPGVPEFDELINLLTRIFSYEEHKLKFPKLRISELVKNRMDLFSLTSGNLGHLAGSEDELNLFLSDELTLKDEALNRLFKILAIRSPVNDQRFL